MPSSLWGNIIAHLVLLRYWSNAKPSLRGGGMTCFAYPMWKKKMLEFFLAGVWYVRLHVTSYPPCRGGGPRGTRPAPAQYFSKYFIYFMAKQITRCGLSLISKNVCMFPNVLPLEPFSFLRGLCMPQKAFQLSPRAATRGQAPGIKFVEDRSRTQCIQAKQKPKPVVSPTPGT